MNMNMNMNETNPIFQTSPYSGMSASYGFVPTFEIVEGLKGLGWVVTEQKIANVRNVAKEGFQRHVVKMTSNAIRWLADDYRPEIAIMNDHCGMGRIKAFVGMHVYACSNGLMTAEDMLGGFSYQHRGDTLGRVIKGVYEVVDRVPQVVDRIKEFKKIELNEDEQEEFAMEAAKIRWGDGAPVLLSNHRGGLLTTRRFGDRGSSLWKTYNVVQENLIKGGIPVMTAAGRFCHTRAIKSVNSDAEINRGLWKLVKRTARKLEA